MRNEANVRARLSRRLGADVTRIRLLRNIYYANRDVYKPLSSEIYFQGFSCFFANGCAYFYWTEFLLQSLNRFSVLPSILDLTDKKYPFNFQYPDLIRKMLLLILYFFFFEYNDLDYFFFFETKAGKDISFEREIWRKISGTLSTVPRTNWRGDYRRIDEERDS